MEHLVLPPESPFSRAVFQTIRPHLAREKWPMGNVSAVVVLAPSGTWLEMHFDGFPAATAELAAQLVRNSRVELILKSPLALLAKQLVSAKRWRDAAAFGLVPLLFAIPFMASLGDLAMKGALLAFCLNVGLLLLCQGRLTRQRDKAAKTKFIAQIPPPGFKFTANSQRSNALGLDSLPEL